METKELLERLEREIEAWDEEGELTGDYILIAGRQDGFQVSGNHNTELLVNGIARLFKILYKTNKEVSTKLLSVFCVQSLDEYFLGEHGQKKEE